jgi:two-component system, response regulator YesN
MYKLILVEDEEDVREGLVQEIDWAACGFEIIDTAENGKEACELIERSVPDVVVTDIKMPFMDGMVLSEWIRERYPVMKIIILTGFDEFEYARKAVKLHIDEYLLKPFSAQELVQVLGKIKSQIDEETAQRENVQTLQVHYRESLPVLREVFLASLLTRRLPGKEIERKSASYGLALSGRSYVVSVISIDHLQEDEIVLGGEQSLRSSKDMELKLFAVRNIADEIVEKHRLGIVALVGDQLAVLTIDEEDKEEALKRTLSVIEEVRQSIEKYLRFTVTIGVGTAGSELTNVAYSYKDAVLALDYRLLLGNNRSIYIEDVETRVLEKLRFDELKEQSLIRTLKVGTAQELREIMDAMFLGIADTPVSITDLQIYLFEIVTAILRAAKDSGAALEPVVGADFNPFVEIGRFTHTEEAKQWILGLCGRLMSQIASNRQHTYKSLIEQALAYMKAHYHDPDITINKLCQHLHISAGYFSTLFKKETKMTFGSYLIQMRMEAAKELLRTTELKAFEIAEKVGYAEPNYFSYAFRKSCGMSPKEYRESMTQGHGG